MINSQNETTSRGILLFPLKEEKLIENDKEGLVMFKKIPVGGRLSNLFLPEWKHMTQDRNISYVIKKEYKLEFEQKPHW